jgi:hypothetical protein
MKILIVGDSFAATSLANKHGWPVLLEKHYNVTNLAQPGVSEYKILKQLQLVNVVDYDLVIVSHTSPYRVHSKLNPFYKKGHIYHTSDILCSDTFAKWSFAAFAMRFYFKYIFDPAYYEYIFIKCMQDISKLLNSVPTLHITHFNYPPYILSELPSLTSYYNIWKDHRGKFNHYNIEGNTRIYNEIENRIEENIICRS